MRVIDKLIRPLVIIAIAGLAVGCGSDQPNKVKVTDSSARDRADLSKQLTATREANERAADRAINGAGPATSIRYGEARANSMSGTSVANANSLPQNYNKSSVSTSQNNTSSWLVAGMVVLALFGKPIAEGGSAIVDGVKHTLSPLESGGKAGNSPPPGQSRQSVANSSPAPTSSASNSQAVVLKRNANGEVVSQSQARKPAESGDGIPLAAKTQQAAAQEAPDEILRKKLELQNCPPDASANAKNLDGFLESISQTLKSEVKS